MDSKRIGGTNKGMPPACFLLVVLFLISSVAGGQEVDSGPERISVEDGLSNPTVSDIVQDERGFLWVATLHGLNRYDGSEVVRFMGGSENGALPADGINNLFLARDSLFVATDRGIAVLDKNGLVARVVHLRPKGPGDRREDRAQMIVRDALGQFWASTPTSVYRLDSNLAVLDQFLTQGNPIASLNRNVYRVIILPTGEILFRVPSGWRYWSPRSRGLEHLEEGEGAKYRFLTGTGVGGCGIVGNRFIISARSDSLSVYDIRTGAISAFLLPDRSEWTDLFVLQGNEFAMKRQDDLSIYALEDHRHGLVLQRRMGGLLRGAIISQVMRDDEGNYWVATTDGLARIAGGARLFHNQVLHGGQEANEGTMEVIDILAHGPHLFIGTAGEGFFQVDPVTGEEQHHFIGPAAAMVNIVWNFRAAGGDTLWVGTQQGLMYYTLGMHRSGRLRVQHPEVMDSVAITTLYEDSHHRVWIGLGRGQGVAMYDGVKGTFHVFTYGPEGYPFPYPLHTGEDARGNLWFISVATGNLVQWDGRTERFRVMEVPGLDATVYQAYGSFLLDRERDEIWYGTVPTGLVCYRIAEGSSHIYGMKDGLPPGRIHSIAKDGRGRLCMGTSQGISCFDPATGNIANYSRSDGLAASSYTALLYDPVSDRISAGTAGFLTWFTVPDQLSDNRPMRIHLTGVEVNGRSMRPPGIGRLSLGPDEGNVTVKFSAINLANGRENRYQYRLNEGEWEDLDKQSEVRFAAIRAGDYHVEVRAARKLGQYGPAHSLLDFTVRPRFTRTYWFYLLSVGVVLLLAWAWYRYRLRNIRRLEAIRAQISRDLHDDIGSRLTNINVMSQIIRRAPVDEGREQNLLGKIQEESEEITRSMREIIWNIDPQNDQLSLAMSRMLSYASQLLEARNIEVQASIGELEGIQLDMAERRDLLLIFKEAVHNITKHSAASKAVIAGQVRKGQFHLQIEDDGKGYDQNQDADGNGLRYMEWRASGHGWDLQIESAPGKGTRVSLFMPIK